MNETKKKAQHRSTAPNRITTTYLNRIESICLIYFLVFAILFIGGYYIHNTPLTFLGLGFGVSGAFIQIDITLSKKKYKQEGEK